MSEMPATHAAVRRLMDDHDRFVAFVQARVGERAVAEDIVQDALVRGLDKLTGLRDEGAAVAWFFRVLRNAVIDRRRRDDVVRRRLDAFAAELAGPAEAEGNVCKCVARLAGELRPDQAEALRRIEVDGVAVKDYAAEAGISRGNAAVRVFRAREALRVRVLRTCGACAANGCVDCSCGG